MLVRSCEDKNAQSIPPRIVLKVVACPECCAGCFRNIDARILSGPLLVGQDQVTGVVAGTLQPPVSKDH